jgi:hypothetical protein
VRSIAVFEILIDASQARTLIQRPVTEEFANYAGNMQQMRLKTDSGWLVMEDEFVIDSKVVTAILSSISLPFFGPMAVFLPNLALDWTKECTNRPAAASA